MRRCRLRRLAQDRRGATAVEFAFIIGPLMLIVLATLDFGYTLYVQGVMQGAIQDAVRVASLGGKTNDDVDNVVKNHLKSLIATDKLTFERKAYYDFTSVKQPEVLTTDKNGNGKYDPGDCWIDANPNGIYDTDSGRAGLGTGDDIFYYKVTATYNRLVPLGKFLGLPDTQTVVGDTMMRNQPYAAQASPKTVCG